MRQAEDGPVMRRRALLALLAGPALMAQAPALVPAPAPVFPPGSAVGLVPPPGMVQATAFAGFQDPAAGASILISELPAEAFAAVSKLDDKALRQRAAITILRRRTLQAGGVPAVLLAGTQLAPGAEFRKWMLVVGASALTAIVTVQVPAAARRAYPDRVVEAALASVAFRQAPSPADAMAALPFLLGDLAGFRVVRTLAGNSVLLTEGPLDVARNAEQPLLVVTWQRQAALPPELWEAYAARRLGAARLRDPDTGASEALQAGGGDWLLTEATGADTDSGRRMHAFQALRFGGDGVLQALGLVRAEAWEAMAPRFRRVALSASPR